MVYTLFFLMRTLIVVVIVGIAFLIPNLSILITFGGAVLGTIVNIVISVLLYNRAYNHSEKNRKLKKKEENMMMNNDGMMDMMAAGDADDAQPMMEGGMEDAKPPEMMMDDMNQDDKQADEEDDGDPRLFIKILSWVILVIGIVIGIWGLVYVVMEMTSGDAKEDSAD